MKRAVIVLGMSFGDEGKGSVVDAVTREIGSTLTIRFCGGPQAAHRVVAADGRSHICSQFGAGVLAGVGTFLSRYVMIDPPAMENEALALEGLGVKHPFLSPGVWIDREAPVITPYHRAHNRLLEWARGSARHGSCGMGIGSLAEDLANNHPIDSGDILRAEDLHYADVIEEKLHRIYILKRTAVEKLRPLLPRNILDIDTELDQFRTWDTYSKARMQRWIERYERFSRKACILTGPVNFSLHDNIVFEGAQGVLLDQTHGFAPHHTWSDCTPANALALLDDADRDIRRITVIGVTRTYATRHGAGPFPTEDPRLLAQLHPEASNHTHPYQGSFRVGHLDAVLLRYSIAACAGYVHGLAVTHVDAPFRRIGLATRYGACTCLPSSQFHNSRDLLMLDRPHYRGYVGENRMANLLRGIEMETQRPILLESHGPTASAKRWTSAWRGFYSTGQQVSA